MRGDMFLVSCRRVLNDGREFHNKETVYRLDKDDDLESISREQILNQCHGKKVLVLVHGFNNPIVDILDEFNTIRLNIMQQMPKEYDYILGFVWPGGITQFEYFIAKHNAREAGRRLRSWLFDLGEYCACIDIMGHSMAAQVGQSALLQEGASLRIRNIFSLGAAINSNIDLQEDNLNILLDSCEHLCIFYTQNDRILKYAYRLIEWHSPIGYIGADPLLLDVFPSDKIHLIDCSDIINDHAGYKQSKVIFRIISQIVEEQKLEPGFMPSLCAF